MVREGFLEEASPHLALRNEWKLRRGGECEDEHSRQKEEKMQSAEGKRERKDTGYLFYLLKITDSPCK